MSDEEKEIFLILAGWRRTTTGTGCWFSEHYLYYRVPFEIAYLIQTKEMSITDYLTWTG